jgi:hypothetical protein
MESFRLVYVLELIAQANRSSGYAMTLPVSASGYRQGSGCMAISRSETFGGPP